MYKFLIPLVTGFAFNAASAFTAVFSRRWGEWWGSRISFIFRNILGIPLWAFGIAWAVRTHSPSWFTVRPAIKALGWVLISAGGGIILFGLKAIRWRAAKPSMRDELVQDGIYAHIRHPIHAGTFLEIAGLWLLFPTRAVTLACTLWLAWVLIQTRLEEIDLVQRIKGYGEYMNRVPRFLPRFWTR
jgi:protein-S-isoprenylcysteine O-methyltransferase Ste14